MEGVELSSQELIKKEYAHLDANYFNSAYFGPSPYRAKQKISNAIFKELDPSFFSFNVWWGTPDRSREQYAGLLGCHPDQITHSTSVSDLNSIIANGIEFNPGDVVCSINGEYPSNVLPWMLLEKNKGVKFELLEVGKLDVDELKKVLPKEAKVLNLSYVTFDTGRKLDIESIGKLCRERDILFILDITQAFGGMGITSKELEFVDVLCGSSYKWLLGPYGHAFGYFSNKAIEKINQTLASWTKSPKSKEVYNLLDYTLETLPGARKFDRGQPANMLVNAALEASLDFLSEVGLNDIQVHNEALRNYFLDNYPKSKYRIITPSDQMANIICLNTLNVEPLKLETELKHHNVDVSVRQGNLRLSFHIMNTTEQVDTLIKALDI